MRAVVLFGSVAAGRAGEWSDCDLPVVAEKDSGERARELLYEVPDEAQVLVRTPKERAEGGQHAGTICRAVSL